MRVYAVTSARSTPPEPPRGRGQMVETARVALAFYPEAGLLVIHARRPRTGGVILDREDLSDDALRILRAFTEEV